jgi:outer membrane protein assembly factor BamB
MTYWRSACVLVVVWLGLASSPAAQDWPQWRGPNRDGAVAAFREPAVWPEQLVRRWQVEIGTGYATPLVVGSRVYAFTRQGADEVMTALDATTGAVVWRTAYAAPFTMNPATSRHGPGPKSTPAFANGRLFTLGMSGIVTAFDATSGKRVWQKPAPPSQPMYHTAMSPVVEGNLVIVHVGGPGSGALTAFDVATGEERWSWRGDAPAYGSPLVADLGGARQVVTFTQQNFVGVALATGQLLWRRPYTTPSTTTSQTPLVYKDTVIESGRANGFTAFRPVRRGTEWVTENVWHTDEVSVHMSDVVAIDGAAFGLSHLNSGQYFALDLDSGKVLWKSAPRQAEHAAIARSGHTIFSLEEDGELVVVRHSRTAFEPITRYEVARSATWPQPAIAGNRVFVKDVSALTLWTLE